MNCFIILLLLLCRGNSNGVGGKNDYGHDHSCGCRDNNDNSCGKNDRRGDDCVEDYYEQRCADDDRREGRREERREEKRDNRRMSSWQDYSDYNRNDSYNRNETCGCEEK